MAMTMQPRKKWIGNEQWASEYVPRNEPFSQEKSYIQEDFSKGYELAMRQTKSAEV